MRLTRYVITVAVSAAMGMFASVVAAQGQEVSLTGASEVPPVTTAATGTGTVTINADHTVTAKISVKGMTATASHIHEGAAGANGPVIVPFVKTADNTFEAPPGAKLTEAQYESYKAGKLYVNVHSAAHAGGEVRAQLAAK
ncbi:MAG: CHRD domain-containing protein [Casimicrobiaceae bacterium]